MVSGPPSRHVRGSAPPATSVPCQTPLLLQPDIRERYVLTVRTEGHESVLASSSPAGAARRAVPSRRLLTQCRAFARVLPRCLTSHVIQIPRRVLGEAIAAAKMVSAETLACASHAHSLAWHAPRCASRADWHATRAILQNRASHETENVPQTLCCNSSNAAPAPQL